MAPAMRAKLVIQHVKPYRDVDDKVVSERIIFRAITKKDGYGVDGVDENNTFAKFTPAFEAEMLLTNPTLFEKYQIGDTFYVDFTPESKRLVDPPEPKRVLSTKS